MSISEELRKFTPRTFWLVTAASALVLGAMVSIPQWFSQQARFDVLRSHVAEIAQLAASAVDGDLHRRLIDRENYTPELYERTLAPLVRFHSANPNIFYVYTMVERDGRTYFVVDTAASQSLVTPHKLRPSGYMEEFEPLEAEPDPDWLGRIRTGQTYVYPSFQRDHYGHFLSGHAPIYDRAGEYSGFVGVDFDIGYYLAQERSFRAIFIGTLATALLMALVIGYLAARYHYDMHHQIDEQYRLSVRDELTQLLNRRGALAAVAAARNARASSYATILVDVDDLKGINDSFGHATGDDFLRTVADAMCQSVRDSDICARLGGDEFMIFASGCDLDAATEIARRLLARVYASGHGSTQARFGVSIGICVATGTEVDFDTMYRRADHALYQAKTSGRNRYVIFDPLAAA